MIMENLYYRFKNISVEQFATLSEELSNSLPLDFETQLSFQFYQEEKVIVSRSIVSLIQGNELKLKSVFDCSFEIKEESLIQITQEDGSVIFPRSVLIQLASLNYGTLRGIIVERTKGTCFSSVFLPPLFVGEIIKEDLVVKK